MNEKDEGAKEANQTSAALIPDADYNRVLEFYVNDESDELDLVGLIAYSLYKRQKRDWIVKHRKDYGGKKPDPSETAAVTDHFLTDDVRATLRERAADLLSAYAETYVEAVEPQIREAAVNNETLRQARAIEQALRSNSGFWQQVGTGLLSTAIWTLVVTAIVVTAYAFGSDVVDAWISTRDIAN